MEDKDPKKDQSSNNVAGYVIFFGIIAVIVLYVLYGVYFVDDTNTPDCYYTDQGCQGDNRWGQ